MERPVCNARACGVADQAGDRHRSIQHRVPESRCDREMAGADGAGRPGGFSASAASRLAFGDFDGDGRMDVVVTALGKDAEIWMNRTEGTGHWLDIALRRDQEQSRRYRGTDQGGDFGGSAVQPHDLKRGIRFVELWPCALRAGQRQQGQVGRNSLALGSRSDVAGCGRRSRA